MVRRDGFFDGRHTVVVERFDWPLLGRHLEGRVRECEGETWGDVAARLVQVGFWEFDGSS